MCFDAFELKVKKWSNFFDSVIEVVFTFKNVNKIHLRTIGQSDFKILTRWNLLTLCASFSKEGRETCYFLLLRSIINPKYWAGVIFVWYWQKIAEPSVHFLLVTISRDLRIIRYLYDFDVLQFYEIISNFSSTPVMQFVNIY